MIWFLQVPFFRQVIYWGCFLSPFVICIAFLISPGPLIQEHFLALFVGNAPSIYATAHAESVAHFPSLGSWLSGGLHWFYLLLAFLIVLFGIGATKLREFAVRLGGGFLIFMTASDAVFQWGDGSAYFNKLMINVAANFIGSVVLAILVLFALCIREHVFKFLNVTAVLHAQLISAGVIIPFGMIASTLLYWLMYFFYHPVPVLLESTFKEPVRGAYSASLNTKNARHESRNLSKQLNSSLLPAGILAKSVRVVSMKGSSVMSWEAGSRTATYTIVLGLFMNCPPEGTNTTSEFEKLLKFEDVKSFRAYFDSGFSQFDATGPRAKALVFTNPEPSIFSFERSKDGDYSLNFFVGGDSTIQTSINDGDALVLKAPVMDIYNNVVRVSPRRLTLVVDGKSIDLLLKPQVGSLSNVPSCAEIAPPERLDFGVIVPNVVPIEVAAGTTYVGVQLSVRKLLSHDRNEFDFVANWIQVSEQEGWLYVSAVEAAALKGKSIGKYKFFDIGSGLSEVWIDGRKIDVNPSTRIVALGEFSGRYDEDHKIIFSGEARLLWLGGKRMVSTKWEHQNPEMQVLLLTLLGFLLLGGWHICQPILKAGASSIHMRRL